jgi:hypothetical protein
MTWTKTSDDFPDDCEVMSAEGYRIHHQGLTWSNRKLLDCLIPKDHVRRFASNPDAIQEVLDHGFWVDEGDHYRIRHHAAYQRSREDVIKLQERNQRNGKAGGRPRKAPREVWVEGQPETQMGSQMETQGDRTGQDRALEGKGRARKVPGQPGPPLSPPCGLKPCTECHDTTGDCRCFDDPAPVLAGGVPYDSSMEPEGWK